MQEVERFETLLWVEAEFDIEVNVEDITDDMDIAVLAQMIANKIHQKNAKVLNVAFLIQRMIGMLKEEYHLEGETITPAHKILPLLSLSPRNS